MILHAVIFHSSPDHAILHPIAFVRLQSWRTETTSSIGCRIRHARRIADSKGYIVKQTRLRFFCVALCCALLCVSAPAQVLTGTIAGIVTDPTGGVIPGANVTATDTETGTEHQAVTDQSGNFSLTNLPNSTYKVVVQHPGFAKYEVAKVVVSVSQTTPLPVKLECWGAWLKKTLSASFSLAVTA